jgi:hypothetical protein
VVGLQLMGGEQQSFIDPFLVSAPVSPDHVGKMATPMHLASVEETKWWKPYYKQDRQECLLSYNYSSKNRVCQMCRPGPWADERFYGQKPSSMSYYEINTLHLEAHMHLDKTAKCYCFWCLETSPDRHGARGVDTIEDVKEWHDDPVTFQDTKNNST